MSPALVRHADYMWIVSVSLTTGTLGIALPFAGRTESTTRQVTADSGVVSRVENRRSGVSLPVAVDWAFAPSPQSGLAWLCFLFPLIEPDRRISRIRLSEKVSRFRPRKAACPSSKFDKAQHLMQGGN